MFKRVVWFGVGAAAGTVGTVWAERKVKSQLDRARPVNLAESARRAVRVAIDEGRIAAREREIELRDRYRIRERHGQETSVMRALGVDLGSKRVGIAVSDSNGAVATPIEVVHRTGDRQAEHRQLRELVEEWEAEVVVVGMPYSLDGSSGPAAEAASIEVEELRATIGVPVETYDERLTTVTADRSLMEMKLTASARRKMVDQVAAAVMLQAWLDHRRQAPHHTDGIS